MNRKEFKVLLEDWRKSLVISERAIPQAHNIESLGHSKSKSIVKKSRQLNGWITYFTNWKGGRDTSGSHIDYSEEGNLDVESKSSIYSKKFLPLAKSLGFEIKNAKTQTNAYNQGSTFIRLGPKMGKEEELVMLLSKFVGEEALKIKTSGCCSDGLPLFIMPFDFRAKSKSLENFKNIDESIDKIIMHWMIHDIWHMIPEQELFNAPSFVPSSMGIDREDIDDIMGVGKKNRDFVDMVSGLAQEPFSRHTLSRIGLKDVSNAALWYPDLDKFISDSGITGSKLSYDGDFGAEGLGEDLGPSLFAYVLTEVENHEDIDREMSILSEEERNLVKAIFDLAPSMWNQICGLFKNEVVILNWKSR